MTVVADASVLVAALTVSGPEGRWAEDRIADADVCCPHLAPVEVLNVLRRLEGSGRIEASLATQAARSMARLPAELFPLEPFAGRIWELRPTLTAYDGWYVALAEALECPLATLDGRLARASGPVCEFLLP